MSTNMFENFVGLLKAAVNRKVDGWGRLELLDLIDKIQIQVLKDEIRSRNATSEDRIRVGGTE